MKLRFVWIPLIAQAVLLPLQGIPTSLQFRGNDDFPDSSLAKSLSRKGLDVKTVAEWTHKEVERAERLVQVYYQDRGYPITSAHLEQASGKSTLTILEGPRTKLAHISFEGNRVFPEDRLIRFFRIGGWFNQGEVKSSVEAIRKLYEAEGYIRVQVQTDQLHIAERNDTSYFPLPFRSRSLNCASLRCRISEGARYHFGRVSFPEDFDLRDLEFPSTGEVFREHLLQDLKEAVARQLEQGGKLVKEIRILQNVNQCAHSVDIQVVVEAHPMLLIRRIEFAGNRRLSDSFYRRELEIQENQMFHPLDLGRSLRRLGETGTLSSLSPKDVELKVDESTQEVDILFHLNEREGQGVFYSIGPGQYGGLDASFAYSILNLLGLGEDLGVNASSGDTTTGIAVELASRYLLGTNLPISMVLQFFSRQSGLRLPGIDDEISELLGIKETGVSGQLEYYVHSKKSIGIGASLAKGEAGARRLIFSSYFRKHSSLKLSQKSSLLWGANRSWNVRPSIGWTRKAGERLKFRMTGSHAFFFGAQEPLSERLFTGPGTIRGISLSGPLAMVHEKPALVGGDTLLALNCEYELQMAQPVSVVPFLDLGWNGNLSNSNQYEIFGNTNRLLRSSTGSELRVKVPRLPEVRLIFSWNPLRFDPEPDLKELGEPSFNFRVAFKRW